MRATTNDGPVTVRLPAGASGRDEHADRGPLADRAPRLDSPAVRVDEVADDRQTQPRAALRARASRVHTVEALEDAGQVLGSNPDPGVRDLQPLAPVGGACAHRDAPGVRVAHRVLDEVREDLPEGGRIHPNVGRTGCDTRDEREVLLRRRGVHRGEYVAHRARDVDGYCVW